MEGRAIEPSEATSILEVFLVSPMLSGRTWWTSKCMYSDGEEDGNIVVANLELLLVIWRELKSAVEEETVDLTAIEWLAVSS